MHYLNAAARQEEGKGVFSETTLQREYPWTADIEGREVTFRLMTAADRELVLDFTRQLPEEDLNWLRMDITKPAIVGQWIENIEEGRTVTVLALEGGAVAGYASLHHNRALWMRHLGEIRLLARSDFRENGLLEQRLANEIFQIAQGLRLYRVFVNVPVDQPRVRAILEQLGFQPEALLPDWLMTADGRVHDMMIMSHPIQEGR